MLAKSERLSRKEFDHFFKLGKRSHSPIATLIVSPHTQFHGAVVVGKKVSKKAVVRNRLRRRVYSVLYESLKRKNHSGVYIVLVKPQAATLSRKDLRTRLQTLIESASKTA